MTGNDAARERAAQEEDARRRELEIAASDSGDDVAEDVEEATVPDEEIADGRRAGYEHGHTGAAAYVYPRRHRYPRGPGR